LNDKLIDNKIHKNNQIKINVDVSASTEAFYDNLFAPKSEQQTAIRQTVLKKASVEAETSTLILKGCF